MSYPLFVDIAKFQPSDSGYFKKLARKDVKGCFVQLNYGNGYPNPVAGAQLRNSLKYMAFTGCYAFFLGDPINEAHYFLSWIRAYGMDKATPVMLDVEPNQSYNGPQTHLINEWTSVVYAHGFHNIWIYAPSSWLSDSYHIKPELLKHGHIWAASYGTSEPGVQADAWQYTDNFDGLNTDGDMLFKPLSIMTGKTTKHVTKKIAKKPKKHVIKHVSKPASKPKPTTKPMIQHGTFKITGTIERLK